MPQGSQVTKWAAMRVLLIAMAIVRVRMLQSGRWFFSGQPQLSNFSKGRFVYATGNKKSGFPLFFIFVREWACGVCACGCGRGGRVWACVGVCGRDGRVWA
jgi:hypothetical protein